MSAYQTLQYSCPLMLTLPPPPLTHPGFTPPTQSHHWLQRDRPAPPLRHGCCHSSSTPAFLGYKLFARKRQDERHFLWLRSSETTWTLPLILTTESVLCPSPLRLKPARVMREPSWEKPEILTVAVLVMTMTLSLFNQLCHTGNILLTFILAIYLT